MSIFFIFCASICITFFFSIEFEFEIDSIYHLNSMGIQFACNIIQYFHSNETQFPQNQLNFLIISLSLVLHNNMKPKYHYKIFLSCIRVPLVGPSPASRNSETFFHHFLYNNFIYSRFFFSLFFVINLAEQTRLLISARNFVCLFAFFPSPLLAIKLVR